MRQYSVELPSEMQLSIPKNVTNSQKNTVHSSLNNIILISGICRQHSTIEKFFQSVVDSNPFGARGFDGRAAPKVSFGTGNGR